MMLFGILLQFISNINVENLHVPQETIMGIFTVNSWAALSFNSLKLMDNKPEWW